MLFRHAATWPKRTLATASLVRAPETASDTRDSIHGALACLHAIHRALARAFALMILVRRATMPPCRGCRRPLAAPVPSVPNRCGSGDRLRRDMRRRNALPASSARFALSKIATSLSARATSTTDSHPARALMEERRASRPAVSPSLIPRMATRKDSATGALCSTGDASTAALREEAVWGVVPPRPPLISASCCCCTACRRYCAGRLAVDEATAVTAAASAAASFAARALASAASSAPGAKGDSRSDTSASTSCRTHEAIALGSA